MTFPNFYRRIRVNDVPIPQTFSEDNIVVSYIKPLCNMLACAVEP